MIEIPKTYNPDKIEQKWYQYWEKNRLFRTDPHSSRKPFCILMPPPNITGELHMGHALQDAIQDMLIRMKRMQGYESHWQPGKDHAGIATQNAVEKSLAAEGKTRHDLGRERFINRVWDWKERFGNRIFEQKRLLGDSADWEQERFTLDPGLSKAVARVFKHLYDKGLIYRGNYIVNWCPRCHTAISDEEVNHTEHDAHLWYFRYPLAGGSDYVTVATTRPETMLGDTAVAVNPEDQRFRSLWNRKVRLPLVDREIPIIRDDFVDPAFGTGQVKVTPAHDPNDFEMGQRHGLETVTVMDDYGRMNENAPEEFRGKDRFEARDAVVEAMRKLGLLQKIEDYKTSIGHCQRCSTMVEPYLSRQWFVKMKPLAEPAIRSVKEGKIRFLPARWEKVYFAWMENIRDWCISRQLWWGHRIPVWYCEDCGAEIVEESTPESCPECKSGSIHQDEDVLDTWFSSWLWPFSSLGWPEDTPGMRYWHPTDVMVTGYDIIFFWVARMIMADLEFTGEIPFHDVYITGMIKDELGRWMSKSLGNGIDPAEMIDQYGGDAVRFTLVALASEGQDIKLSSSRFEGGRNFANKLWNTYRFLLMHADRLQKPLRIEKRLDQIDDAPLPDRWIISRLNAVTGKVLENADRYRLNDCMTALYDFVWKEYCDWYLELIKVRLTSGSSEETRQGVLETAIGIFEAALRLLHPGMPFITEEMWQNLKGNFVTLPVHPDKADQTAPSIVDQRYPVPGDFPRDDEAVEQMDFIQRLVTSVRVIRSEMRIPPDKTARLVLRKCSADKRNLVESNSGWISTLAVLSDIEFSEQRPPQSGSAVVDEVELLVPLAGLIDIDLERSRIDKEITRLKKVIGGAEGKLNNPKFIQNAPSNVVDHEKKKLSDCRMQLEAVERNRNALE